MEKLLLFLILNPNSMERTNARKAMRLAALASESLGGGASGGYDTYDFHEVAYTFGNPQYRRN